MLAQVVEWHVHAAGDAAARVFGRRAHVEHASSRRATSGASSSGSTTSHSPDRMFSAMYPSMFTGSLADENGGA